MPDTEVEFDFSRAARIGLSEAVLCEGKSLAQIEHIVSLSVGKGSRLLLTRLSKNLYQSLDKPIRQAIDYDAVSRTGVFGKLPEPSRNPSIAIVAAGSSDMSVVREASRTLAFHGEAADEIIDIGVAGLWRVVDKQERLRSYRALIVVAGMDGALFSVIGGLVGGAVIAVPTATGYGVTNGGQTALNAALVSCAPGVVVANIGNGYGGACAALRVINASRLIEGNNDPNSG